MGTRAPTQSGFDVSVKGRGGLKHDESENPRHIIPFFLSKTLLDHKPLNGISKIVVGV